ncbi:hypothetical protein AWC23_20290 [Mycobacterium saskatchewanense]|uniref:Uncharacterized protein n=1 Tax=Mycobacterium saskatchewanense TaxID=220927 RepID=A0AAJ3TVP4_9MYCO|nr:hypothetical protein AWC23_20290 [Mycobacterium saskatchewanense]
MPHQTHLIETEEPDALAEPATSTAAACSASTRFPVDESIRVLESCGLMSGWKMMAHTAFGASARIDGIVDSRP